jgi:putative transposase
LWRDITDREEPPTVNDDESKRPKHTQLKSRKIRIFPTALQRNTLRRWFDGVRWTYNQCVEYLRGTTGRVAIKDLRERSSKNEQVCSMGRKDLLDIPYGVRDEGVRDAYKARGAALAKIKLGKNKTKFELHFRRKKKKHDTLTMHRRMWASTRGAYFDLFGTRWSKMASAEKLPHDLPSDSRLLCNNKGEYYLIMTVPIEVGDENQVPDSSKASVVSLDPGVRTFMTAYSADGEVVEWGVGDVTRLHRLCHAMDKLDGRARDGDINHRKRYRLKRARGRVQTKIGNIVDELHHKLARWLSSNFHVILIPVFETQQMVSRVNRKINSKTARSMLNWKHFTFRTRLVSKAREFGWSRVVTTTEEYTSKTCGQCGNVDQKLGSNKTYTCAKCDFQADRDHNGARNILIRYLTKECVCP